VIVNKEIECGLAVYTEVLDSAPRNGGEKDEPEGTRFIIISDTLAKQMSEFLKKVSLKIWNLDQVTYQ